MIRGLTLEEYGGDVQAIAISALRGTNVSQLMEAILVLAELSDLKAAYSGLVEGIILESKLDRHKGFVECTSIYLAEGEIHFCYLRSVQCSVQYSAMYCRFVRFTCRKFTHIVSNTSTRHTYLNRWLIRF